MFYNHYVPQTFVVPNFSYSGHPPFSKASDAHAFSGFFYAFLERAALLIVGKPTTFAMYNKENNTLTIVFFMLNQQLYQPMSSVYG